MREWLGVISEPVVTGIDGIALLVIVVEVLVKVVRAMFKPLGHQSRPSYGYVSGGGGGVLRKRSSRRCRASAIIARSTCAES